MIKLIPIILLAFPLIANAECIAGPSSSVHKSIHLLGTALVASGVTIATENAKLGLLAGVAVGAVREAYKERTGNKCEYYSIAYDLAGATIGSYSTYKWYVVPKKGGLSVGYVRAF